MIADILKRTPHQRFKKQKKSQYCNIRTSSSCTLEPEKLNYMFFWGRYHHKILVCSKEKLIVHWRILVCSFSTAFDPDESLWKGIISLRNIELSGSRQNKLIRPKIMWRPVIIYLEQFKFKWSVISLFRIILSTSLFTNEKICITTYFIEKWGETKQFLPYVVFITF